MTGPLGPMDDDGVVDLLRAAGHGGREPSPTDVSRAMTAGRRIRRRRQAMQAAGSTLAIVAVLGVGVATVSALGNDERGTAVTTSPDIATPVATPPAASPVSGAQAREANVQLLLDALGPDFRKNTKEEGPGATLRPSTPSAAGLPDGYDVTASIWVGGPSDGYVGLEDLCTPLVEDALRRSACEAVRTADGRTVQLQTRHSVLQAGTIGGAYNQLVAFFDRGDGTVAEVRMQAADETAAASAARQQTAAGWLAGYTDKLVNLAADPRVKSDPSLGSAPGPDTDVSNEEVLAVYLPPPFAVTGNGTVELPPGSEYDPPLPGDTYLAVGEISTVTEVQFDAVCNKPGSVPCTRTEGPGDREIWVWGYADRDAPSGEVRGERAVYFVQEDGTIVLASLRLTGTDVPAAQAAEQVPAVKTWLEQFDDALIGAATDSRLTFETE